MVRCTDCGIFFFTESRLFIAYRFLRVVGVGEKDVSIMDKKTRKTETVPYGLCVWSAGIAARPVTKQLIGATPGQNNR